MDSCKLIKYLREAKVGEVFKTQVHVFVSHVRSSGCNCRETHAIAKKHDDLEEAQSYLGHSSFSRFLADIFRMVHVVLSSKKILQDTLTFVHPELTRSLEIFFERKV
jgi:hypothetical protein